MEAIKDYLLSVTAAALICGIVSSLAGKNSASKLFKLLSGLFLAVTVIKPVVDMKVNDIFEFTDSLAVDSDFAVLQGEKMAEEEMKRIIKDKCEAYILDKAKALGAEITVVVTLDELVPAQVAIEGDISPFIRSHLATTIAKEMNIPPEEQIWK